MIEHIHPYVDHYTQNAKGDLIAVCVGPLQYEILIHSDGWGYFPVQGSGAKVKCRIPESVGHTQYLLTQDERDAFVAQYFPATREYELEQKNDSLTSAVI